MRITNAVNGSLVALISLTTFARDVEFPSSGSRFFRSDQSMTEDFPPAFFLFRRGGVLPLACSRR
jgi:hypothetical protein